MTDSDVLVINRNLLRAILDLKDDAHACLYLSEELLTLGAKYLAGGMTLLSAYYSDGGIGLTFVWANKPPEALLHFVMLTDYSHPVCVCVPLEALKTFLDGGAL